MLPEYPEFRPLELEDKDLLAHHLNLCSRKICELSLANFYIWKDFDQPRFTFINQNLCLLLSSPIESPYFLEPLGKNKLLETVETCLKHAGRISRASEDFVSLLPQKSFKLSEQRHQFDYVYSTKELAELKGRKFDGKRNHIKKFMRRFPAYEFVPLKPEFKEEALELFKRWFELRKASRYFPKLAYTAPLKALDFAFNNFDRLNLSGGALLVEKSLKGFVLGSILNPETIDIHFQYGHPDLPGISQTLLWEACRKTFAVFTYINLEQDLGIPGLRKAKLSYHPLWLEKRFEINPFTALRKMI